METEYDGYTQSGILKLLGITIQMNIYMNGSLVKINQSLCFNF